MHAVVLATCSSFEQVLRLSPFAISFCIDSRVNCNCCNSFHKERSRDCTVRCFNTCLATYQPVTSFPTRNTTEHFRITNQPWFTNQSAPPPWCVFFMTRRLDLEKKKSRSCFVCHCAPQLKFEGAESTNTTVDSEKMSIRWKLCTKNND